MNARLRHLAAAAAPYAKALTGVAGLALTILSAVLVPGSTPALIVSCLIAAATAAGIYRVPNAPLPAAAAAAVTQLKAAQQRRRPAVPPGGPELQDQIRTAAQRLPPA